MFTHILTGFLEPVRFMLFIAPNKLQGFSHRIRGLILLMPTHIPRLPALDQFRGFAILGMVIVNYLARIQIVPSWLKHAPDAGLTVADLVAPFFIFAIGLTYRASFERRVEKAGLRTALLHALQRNLVLIGIGAILSASESMLGIDNHSSWGVLQAIGVAGIINLLFIRLPLPWTALVGLGLLGSYQYMLDNSWKELVLHSSHGGILGSLSWAAMLTLATVLAGWFFDPKQRARLFPLAAAACLVGGLFLSTISSISKNRVSAAYVLVSLGISALLFLVFYLLSERARLRMQLLELWGRNPLALYLLHLLFLGLFALPPIPWWYEQAPFLLVLAQAAALIAFLTGTAVWLERHKIFIKL
jgi:predicted acyltransferase